ncbi:MAG: hypothetical protein ABFS10_14205 [Bacteroidota bacterium]
MILLRIFKDNRVTGIAALFLLSLGLFMKSFIQLGEVSGERAMPLYNLFFGSVHTVPFLDRFIALILFLILGYMLIRIGVRYVLLDFRSYMPALFFLLFSVALPSTQHVTPAVVGSIFYLLCFSMLFDVHDKRPDTFTIFNAGLLLVLGSMFYLKLIWFLPLIWISLATMRSVTWREILYPVIAYLMLGLFLFTWYWAIMDDAAGFWELVGRNLAFEGSLQSHHYSVYIYYGFFLALVALVSLYMTKRLRVRKTVIKNLYLVLFYMFIAGILFFLFIARFDPSSLVFVALPLSFILSDYFHRKRNHWLHELALWILVGLLVFVQWMV